MKTTRSRPAGYRLHPEKIILGPKNPASPSSKLPVRIFVGTETAQARAERIFVWSIDLVRDPSRTYEIYLMKELTGFDRRRWLTGFTNYRFAIPDLAGGSGRAIYNDVDQIYLSDPGELFDLDLKEHGFLSIAKNDSSVMIMDCQKMQSIWTIDRARNERKTLLLKDALTPSMLWGKLGPEWNARDEEYVGGTSKVLHYTALHTQPWNPFPHEFVYQESPVGYVWDELEQSANKKGFQLFSRSQPSSQFSQLSHMIAEKNVSWQPSEQASQLTLTPFELDLFLPSIEHPTLLHYGLDTSVERCSSEITALFRSTHSLDIHTFNWCGRNVAFPKLSSHIVYASEGLALLPDEDVPWILEEIFSLASHVASFTIQDLGYLSSVPTYLKSSSRDFDWWANQLQAISSRHSNLHWNLQFQTKNRQGKPAILVRSGGWLPSPPSMWILSDGKVGHSTQSVALAKSLGWPYETKELHFQTWNKTQKLLWGVLPPHTLGLNKQQSSPLSPPWPDIVISTGWRPAPIARWIRDQNEGKTRIIQLGRKGGGSADLFDVVITPSYYGFPPHPHRIETLAPLNDVPQEHLDKVTQQWPNLFDQSPHPRIVFVVGGSTARFTLTANFASTIGRQLKDLASTCGGTIFAVTSPRTGHEVSQALQTVLLPGHHLHRWQPHQSANPYLAYLAGADVIIVTGESESMLAEAASLGKPVYIIPLPEKAPTWKIRLSEAIVKRAQSRPLNKRGTVRPQQGLEHLCAQFIRSGLVQPRRDLTLLHNSLIQQGIARPFGEPIENGKRPQLRETERVAKKIKKILGIFEQDHV